MKTTGLEHLAAEAAPSAAFDAARTAPAIVAVQGEPGSFSDAAAHRLLGAVRLACFDAFEDAAASVAAGAATYAVLPIENSIAGPVLELSPLLGRYALEVLGDVTLPVPQALIAAAAVELRELREVRSHPVALAQCGRFLAAHPWLRAVAVSDTAGAVREVCAVRRRDLAAIGPASAAALHGAFVLAEDVADRSDNRTRFVLVRSASVQPLSSAPAAVAAETTKELQR